MAGLIHYVCIADAHSSRESRSDSDTLTIVSGRWAYCGGGTQNEGHDWRETDGVTIELLRTGLPHGRLAQLPLEDRAQ
jgi:hypothetical protein